MKLQMEIIRKNYFMNLIFHFLENLYYRKDVEAPTPFEG